jgi:NAD(P)H dehydrogenase (quinone)
MVWVDKCWSKIDGKFGCAFSSAGGLGGGSEFACIPLLTVLINFSVLVFGVRDYVAKQRTLHYGAKLPVETRTLYEKDIYIHLGQRLAEFTSYCNKLLNIA